MKRYRIDHHGQNEHEQGEWVRYDDHQDELGLKSLMRDPVSSLRTGHLLIEIGVLRELIKFQQDLLGKASEHVCSLLCPSTKIGDSPWPHVQLCKDISEALEASEQDDVPVIAPPSRK